MSVAPENQPELLTRITQALSAARAQVEETKNRLHEPIAIIGIGCRVPGANGPDAFWDLLANGVDAIREIPADRWDVEAYYHPDPERQGKIYTRSGGFLDQVDQFDPQFFGITPRETVVMDPQQRLLLEIAWEALEHAGQAPDALRLSKTGVFIGISTSDYVQLCKHHSREELGLYFGAGTLHSFAVGRISYILGLQGPSVHLDTVCSSSLVAVHLACQSLRAQEADLALAGGVNLILAPENTIERCMIRALAPDGRSKAFDASANGFGQGEGCGIVVLKRLSDALAADDNILAVIRGSAVNHDGPSSGLTVPNEAAQEKLIRAALANARVKPDEIGYVEAHGTGTTVGDPIEINALGAVFGQRSDDLLVGSVKGNIGHLEAAAGVAGLIKLVLALQHKTIPPHLHLQIPNPYIPWDSLSIRVPTTPTPWPAGKSIAGLSAFGMSGTNAHLIIEEAPPPNSKTQNQAAQIQRPAHLLTLSAKSEDALRELAQRYVDHLQQHPAGELGDLCYTTHVGRNHFEYRLSVTAESVTQMQHALTAYRQGEIAPGLTSGIASARQARPRVGFLFTGQGSQYVGMGRELYRSEPTFRTTLDRCDEILQEQLGESILAVLYGDRGHREIAQRQKSATATQSKTWAERSQSLQNQNSKIDETRFTQPALFAVEYALAQVWLHWGVQPAFVLGHSVGEVVAACVAGVFSLEDALQLVAARGRLMGALPQGGAMVSLLADEARVQAALAPYAATVSLAAVNGPQSVVISGERGAVEAISAQLAAEGVKTHTLKVSHAFHSPLMEPMLADFRQVAQGLRYSRPTLPLVSTLTGHLAGDDIATPEYWVRHVRHPVRFADGLQTLHHHGCTLFLELGPKPTLVGLAQGILEFGGSPPGTMVAVNEADGQSKLQTPKSQLYLPSLRTDRSDWQQLLESLGALYGQGVPIDWRAFDQPYPRRKVSLPTYPFQRQRYWINSAQKRRASETLRPLVDRMFRSPVVKETLFETDFSLDALPFLADHRVFDTVASPGACQLAMILSCAELAFGTQTLQLDDVLLPQPLVMPEAATRRVQVLFTPVAANGSGPHADFQLLSFDSQDEAAKPAIHATGQVAPWQGSPPAPVDLPALQRRCGEPRDVAALYASVAARQIVLGPAFRWLDQVWLGRDSAGGEALAKLRLPASLDSLAEHLLHPGLLDACFQLAGLAHALDAGDETRLPFALRALRLYQPAHHQPAATTWWCHALQTGEEQWDVQLLDELGQMIGQIEGLNLRPASSAALRSRDAWRDWLYTVEWQPRPYFGLLPDLWIEHDDEEPQRLLAHGLGAAAGVETEDQASPIPPAAARVWLLLADEQGLGAALAAQLRRHGDSALLAYAHHSYQQVDEQTFRLRPDHAADYQALLAAIPRVHGIVQLWSLDGPGDLSAAALERAAWQGCGPLLHLVQALVQRQLEPAGLWLVTQDAQAVNPQERVHGVGQAPLWGMGKVIALEHPELPCVSIDLDATGDLARQALPLWAEITATVPADGREKQVALRQDARYVARLARYPAASALAQPATNPPKVRIQAGATYLITGGLGGLGLAVARWLAEQGARHLLLIGRRPANAAAQRQLDALADLGVAVTVAQADVTNLAQLKAVVQRVDPRYPVRGVVHAVGVLDDGALLQQNWSRFASVLAPKAQGAWHLHELSKDGGPLAGLDFFVLFSSLASLLGNRGQANYAAANAFLDALAHYRRGQGLPALCINWGAWAEIGMAAELVRDGRHQIAQQGLGFLSPQQGLDALAYLLEQETAQVGVIPLEWSKFLDRRDAPQPFYATFAQPPLDKAVPTTPAFPLRQQLAAASAEQRSLLLMQHLRTAVAQVVGLRSPEQIDPRQGLMELGVDSLMAVEVRNRLSRTLDQPLPSTLLFDYPTLERLAGFLLETLFASQPALDKERTTGATGASVLGTLVASDIAALTAEELMAQIAKDFQALG
jgi:acyl transferase domain-containing protein/acyl carrier protein